MIIDVMWTDIMLAIAFALILYGGALLICFWIGFIWQWISKK